jgi:hypothetical protein
VSPALDYAAAVKDIDHVRVLDCAELVGDGEYSAAFWIWSLVRFGQDVRLLG